MKQASKKILLAAAACWTLWQANAAVAAVPTYDKDAAKYVHQWVWTLTDAMVDEIRTPCTISRVYSYCNVAAYEAAVPGYPGFRSFGGQLNGLKPLPNRQKPRLTGGLRP